MDNVIEELVSVANLFELVKASAEKVGLEYMAPIAESRTDEIISEAINCAFKD